MPNLLSGGGMVYASLKRKIFVKGFWGPLLFGSWSFGLGGASEMRRAKWALNPFGGTHEARWHGEDWVPTAGMKSALLRGPWQPMATLVAPLQDGFQGSFAWTWGAEN